MHLHWAGVNGLKGSMCRSRGVTTWTVLMQWRRSCDLVAVTMCAVTFSCFVLFH